MTDKRDEALKLALEALEVATTPLAKDRQEVLRAQAAIREALAEQPAQQHIEHCLWARNGHQPCPHVKPAQHSASVLEQNTSNSLETTNQEAQQQQEPVAYLYHDARTPKDAHPWLHSTMLVLAADRRPGLRGETPLYTSPPASKPWVGLTAMEIEAIGKPYEEKDRSIQAWGLFACAIEAKLREKNAQPSKSLTDEQIQTIAFEAVKENWDWLRFARAIEAAHAKGDA